LDALCRRYGIDNTERTLHGALLDSEILAEVYLELIGGRQPDFILDNQDSEAIALQLNALNAPAKARPTPLNYTPVEAELQAHMAFVETLDNPIWKRL
jgi:DNA polymerase-3 subunit epsilon